MTIEIDTNKHKERNSSFELLRILCMLFVIGGHLIGKGMQIPYDGTSPWGGGRLYARKTALQHLCCRCKHFHPYLWIFRYKV